MTTYVREESAVCVVYHLLIVIVHVCRGDAWCRAELPVVRVVLPKHGAEPHAARNGADPVVDVAERGLR